MSPQSTIEEQVVRLETRALELTLVGRGRIEDAELREVWRDAQELEQVLGSFPKDDRLRTRLEAAMAELQGLKMRLQLHADVRPAA